MEKNLDSLAKVQDQMMDLLGFTMEGERRLATRAQRHDEAMAEIDAKLIQIEQTVSEIAGKLNGLIGVVDGWVRRG